MKNLRLIRKTKMSQEEFAKRLGLSQAQISNLENGKVRIDKEMINLICQVLGCSEEQLVGEKLAGAKDDYFDIRCLNMILLMRKKGMNMKNLADEIGVSRQLISEFFAGRENLSKSNFDKVSKVLIGQNATIRDLEVEPQYKSPPLKTERNNSEYLQLTIEILDEIKFNDPKHKARMFPIAYDIIEDYCKAIKNPDELQDEKIELEIKKNILNKLV